MSIEFAPGLMVEYFNRPSGKRVVGSVFEDGPHIGTAFFFLRALGLWAQPRRSALRLYHDSFCAGHVFGGGAANSSQEQPIQSLFEEILPNRPEEPNRSTSSCLFVSLGTLALCTNIKCLFRQTDIEQSSLI